MFQQSFSFDEATMRNIVKGFLHSAAVTFLLLLIDTAMQMAGQVHISDPIIAAVYAYVCQNVYNIGKEYIKGK